MSTKKKALFLDRDGVINIDHGYVHTPEQFEFVDGIFELCQSAVNNGYCVIVVTNQAGIGRGYFSETQFHQIKEWMCERFKDKNVLITDVFYCPCHPEYGVGHYRKESFNRKPNPGMLLRAAEKHRLDLKRSLMIGDKDSDMHAANKAGIGIRCHYLVGTDGEETVSDAATHKIHSLHDAISLLSSGVGV